MLYKCSCRVGFKIDFQKKINELMIKASLSYTKTLNIIGSGFEIPPAECISTFIPKYFSFFVIN